MQLMPEIAIVVVVIAVVAAARQLLGIRPFPFAPRPSDLRLRQPAMATEQLRARMVASEIIFAMVSLPLILRVVPPNGIYGFRTHATLASKAAWYSANAFQGWAMLIAAVIGTAVLMALPATCKRWTLWLAFVVPVACAIAMSFAYVSRYWPV